jgi:hypothetical protein
MFLNIKDRLDLHFKPHFLYLKTIYLTINKNEYYEENKQRNAYPDGVRGAYN